MHFQLPIILAYAGIVHAADPDTSLLHHMSPPLKTLVVPVVYWWPSGDCSSAEDGHWKPIHRGHNCTSIPSGQDSISFMFGRGSFAAPALTLFTDAKCKNVAKAGTITAPAEPIETSTLSKLCIHPSKFNEKWGSVQYKQ